MNNPVVVITEALGRAVSVQEWLENVVVPDFSVEHPRDEAHGDYATNIALLMYTNLKSANSQIKSPRELAQKLVTNLQNDTILSTLIDTTKIEVAGAGFINFTLKQEFLLSELQSAKSEKYGKNENLRGKKIMVEYTDPNPFKEMHIGHLMSNTIGESLTRLLEMQGAEVKRACYQGDVGLHVAKAVWGMMEKFEFRIQNSDLLKKIIEEWQGKSLNERQQMMGQAYAYGAAQYEEDPKAKEEMHALNVQIYQQNNKAINELYKIGRSWSLEYFETIYSRLGTRFDEYFFESEAGPVGLEVIEEGIKKGVLEEGEGGAVVYHGEKDGLHTRVFRNKLGLATYEGKELGLSKTKYERYKYDLSYIVTANEITEYFKVLLKVMSQLYPELASKTTHIPHGMMKLTTGKMSSRSGKVVTGEGLLNTIQEKVWHKINERTKVQFKSDDPYGVYTSVNAKVSFGSMSDVADDVAVGALKYLVLRQSIGNDVVYDLEKMTNFEGATGPFVQYTFARAKSILRKFKITNSLPAVPSAQLMQAGQILKLDYDILEEQEFSLLRWIYRYPEVVNEAGRALSPHMIATYITELSSRFNSFYQACRVEENGEVNTLRYELSEAVANVLKSGLNVIGIVAPEEM